MLVIGVLNIIHKWECSEIIACIPRNSFKSKICSEVYHTVSGVGGNCFNLDMYTKLILTCIVYLPLKK